MLELLETYRKLQTTQNYLDEKRHRINEIAVKELTRLIHELTKMNEDCKLSEIISNMEKLRAIFPESIVKQYYD